MVWWGKKSLLLQKLGRGKHKICKSDPTRGNDKTVEILSKIFDKRDSLFHTWYKCLNIIKQEDDDFVNYAGMVNTQCEAFKLKELSCDMFKCLIFVQGLTAPNDKEIRSRILTIMEQDPNIALQSDRRMSAINKHKKDNTWIEEKSISWVQTVRQQKWIKNKENIYIYIYIYILVVVHRSEDDVCILQLIYEHGDGSAAPAPAQSLEQWRHWKSVVVITAEAALWCLSGSSEFLASSLFEVGSSNVNWASPFWSVLGIFLQVSQIDVAPLEIGFDRVFIPQFWSTLFFFCWPGVPRTSGVSASNTPFESRVQPIKVGPWWWWPLCWWT